MTEPPNPLDVIGQLRRTSSMTSNVYPYLADWQRDAIVAAAALIAAQAEEIERLQAERDTARDLLDSNVSSLGKSLAEAGRNVEKLRSALEPFAPSVDLDYPDDKATTLTIHNDKNPHMMPGPTWGSFRAARLLTQEQK